MNSEQGEVVVAATAQTPASRPRRWRFRSRLVVYVLAAYVAGCGVLYIQQDQLIFPANMAPAPLPRPPVRSTIITQLPIGDGAEVESWFLPAPGVNADHPGPAVVFFHGNAEIIDYLDDIVAEYHRLGVSVLLPEYRGYGASGGRPSQEGLRNDCVRFVDDLRERPEVDASRIAFHGRSLGGGVACDVARLRPPAAIILQSTFFSLASMADGYGVPQFLVRHPFRNDRALAELDLPVLIFHGAQDTIIPVRHGRRLKEVARQATYVEYATGHNDLPRASDEEDFWQNINTFLIGAGVIEP